MRDGRHRRRGKAFEEPELVQAAVNLWLNEMHFESHAQAATVLGVHRSAVWRWRNRKSRPDTTTLRRMIRLLLWQAEGWRAAWFRSVAWADLSVEFVEGRELPNPFSLTLPTSTSSGVTFPFGSLRDCGAFLRALVERFGVESRGHLIALLGMPHHTSAYDHVRHWTHGQWAIGPQYLARVLVLVLWAAKPHRFAALSDLWAVDWPGRSVKWTKRRQQRVGVGRQLWHAAVAVPSASRLRAAAERTRWPAPRPGEVLRGSGRAGAGLRSGPGCISGVSVHYRWDVASWVSMVNLVISRNPPRR